MSKIKEDARQKVLDHLTQHEWTGVKMQRETNRSGISDGVWDYETSPYSVVTIVVDLREDK